jgi:hypothetical protein
MRAAPPSIASQAGWHWPIAGFFSTAYRRANVEVSRSGALFAASLFFYLI